MAVTVFDINTKVEKKQNVINLKQGFIKLFNRVQEAEICIVSDFPAIGSSYGKTDYLIFINIPYKQGNYYLYRNKERNCIYLNSLVIGIKEIEDDGIEIINNNSFFSSQAEFDYKENLEEESYELVQFAKNIIDSQFNDCAFIYIVKSDNKEFTSNDYVFLSNKIYLNRIIEAACERTRLKNKSSVNNFKLSKNIKFDILFFIL